jgi:hypothetical protein
MGLQSAGTTDAATLFSEALENTPTRAFKIRKAWAARAKNISVPYMLKEALPLFTEAHLTKSQYKNFEVKQNCRTAQVNK